MSGLLDVHTTTPPWHTLPDEIWVQVFANLTPSQLLNSCSMVSTRFHMLAAAATKSITLRALPEGFFNRLLQRGVELTSLKLSDCGTITELPCTSLLELAITATPPNAPCLLQLGAANGHPGVLHGLTKLTSLTVSFCPLLGDATALGTVTTLQHLCYVVHWDGNPLPAAVLQHLIHLTHLHLSGIEAANAETFEHISCLQALHTLELNRSNSTNEVILSIGTTPGFSRLTALVDIKIENGCLQPVLLAPLTGLQRLVLLEVQPQSGPQDASGASAAADQFSGGAAVLALLAALTRLTNLHLDPQHLQWPTAPASYSTFSALTASSCLQYLELPNPIWYHGDKQAPLLPSGAWQHVFREPKQLPHLRNLMLSSSITMQQADVERMASACPHVELMLLSGVLMPDVQLGELAQLTSLNTLVLEGVTMASCKSLVGVTQLRDLEVVAEGNMDVSVLMALTALTRLTRLQYAPRLDDRDNSEYPLDNMFEFENKAQLANPDVCTQLFEHCTQINNHQRH